MSKVWLFCQIHHSRTLQILSIKLPTEWSYIGNSSTSREKGNKKGGGITAITLAVCKPVFTPARLQVTKHIIETFDSNVVAGSFVISLQYPDVIHKFQ